MSKPYIARPSVKPEFVHHGADLPYNLAVKDVLAAIDMTYAFLCDLNRFLVGENYRRIEDMLLGNSFAGILSEIVVQNLGKVSPSLERNRQVGGFPDLLPTGFYENSAVLRGAQGIEVKVSKQKGGWQGHNPEQGWYMIFRYTVDTKTQPEEERRPVEFVQVLAAELDEDDWNFSGRHGSSRRTITASINHQGIAKLRANPIYQDPAHVVGRRR
ncbi:MAG: hypothetical protein JXB47_07530 [Anaerolineae bacterium]|nr:hypothetical protein [Anaerolineae bacterium]